MKLLSDLVKEGVRSIVLFSIWNPEIRQFEAFEKEVKVYKISGASRDDCLTALRIISDGKANLKDLINQKVSLKSIKEAYKLALNPSQGKYTPEGIGVIINP